MMSRAGFGGVKGERDRERALRSVFVGNIAYDTSEQSIRDLFSTIGTIVGMRLMIDRETGKSKGYAFIEYQDVVIAEAAVRNLNGHELQGRQLRVDSSASEKSTKFSRDDPVEETPVVTRVEEESPYGPTPEDGKTAEAISRTVASLPPEKMFELMKQMKEICQTDQQQARQMLLANPQLSYALLQAAVVMRIVDPQVALMFLHREAPTMTAPFHGALVPGGVVAPVGAPPLGAAALGVGGVPVVPPPPMVGAIPPAPVIAPSGGIHIPPPPRIAAPQFGLAGTAPAPSTFSIPPPGYNPAALGLPGGPPPVIPPPPVVAGPSAVPPPGAAAGPNDVSAEEQQNAELLVKVLQLRDDEIDLLDPEDRAKVLQLRASLRQAAA